MVYLVVQTVLLLSVAFILGAICGCLLRRLFTTEPGREATAPRAAIPAAGVAAASVPVASPVASDPASLPHVPAAPMPDEVDEEVAPEPLETEAVTARPVIGEPIVSERVDNTDDVGGPLAEADVAAVAAAAAPAGLMPAPEADQAERDNLKLIRGIGPQNEARLNEIGVTRFAQIAAWTKREQREIGERLSFPGRIERENWVAQAKKLARGKATEYSARPGAGRVRTSSARPAAADGGTPPPTLDAPREGGADNLTLIDGVGNAIERKLFRLGVFHFDQMAAWSEAEAVWIGNEIGFPGRPQRENWVAEARIFAEGGTTEHAERVERGRIKTSRKSDE